MNRRDTTGAHWESIAARFLGHHGIKILARRYRCRFGEIDLIGRHGDTLIIVEVKARRGGALVSALESVDARKQTRILRTSQHFLARNQKLAGMSVRMDVVAIDGIDTARPHIQWIPNAFEQT